VSDTDGITDGYHTFGELYEHRSALLASIMREFPALSWMARQHHDGSAYPGWFIAGMQLPTGQISYHLRIDPWWSLLATTRRDDPSDCPGMGWSHPGRCGGTADGMGWVSSYALNEGPGFNVSRITNIKLPTI
jgi:hypothetical protein